MVISELYLHFELIFFSSKPNNLTSYAQGRFLVQESFLKWKNTLVIFFIVDPLSLSWGTLVSKKQFVGRTALALWDCAEEASRCYVLYFWFIVKLLFRGKMLLRERKAAVSEPMLPASCTSLWFLIYNYWAVLTIFKGQITEIPLLVAKAF